MSDSADVGQGSNRIRTRGMMSKMWDGITECKSGGKIQATNMGILCTSPPDKRRVPMKHLPDLHFNKIDLFWAPEMTEGKNLIQIIVPEHKRYFLDYNKELPSRHTLFCFTRAALPDRMHIQ